MAGIIAATPNEAQAIPTIGPKCRDARAPVLCAIKVTHHRANALRDRMGLRHRRLPKHTMDWPTRRPYVLWLERYRYAKLLDRWRIWQLSPRSLGRILAAQRGWTGSQWSALDEIWGGRESGWNPRAVNPYSGACGIPQFYPCRSYGWDARQQILAGFRYIAGRYGSPLDALAFHNAHGYY